MFKKKLFLLLVLFCVVFISLNALTEEEKQEIFERGKREFIAKLDSFITNNKPIISESYTYSDESAIKTFNGDIRQIDIFYKYVLYGDKITQKKGIDGMVRWFGNPQRAEKYKQDTIFVSYRPKIIQLIYEFLDDEYPALQVTAARTLAYLGFSDNLVIDKLEYYANGTDSQNWNLENTLVYQCLHHYLHYGGTYTKKELEQKRQRAIKEIKDISKIGLNIIKSRNKKKKFQIKENKKSFNNYNLKRHRDLDWDGNTSAAYCEEWYGPEITDWNPDYASYPGNDCANFASQCLISGYYEDITYSAYADTCGCIPYCPNLHDYLSNRFDVITTIVDFHTNGWENGIEPNNHIPANFSVGDIAVLGKQMWGADSLYQHAIICCKFESGTHYFGAHSNNQIDRTMTWFIGPDIEDLDYATFYHITNDWNCNTQIAGGAVSGTWTHANSPYCINGEITIPVGSQLTIEPGVDVIFTGHYKFNIYGRLVAEGDWQRYINFTAQNQTTGWHGLRFYDQNSNGQDISKVVYCKLQYGKATGTSPDCNGGAIYLDNSDILIDNCIISNNTVIGGGGGVFIYNSSDPTIKRSIIRDNTSESAGGGIYIWDSCTPTFENVCIYNNEAVSEAFGRGGGIYCDNWCFPILTNVTFSLNTANYNSPYPGGGLFSCNNSYPTLLNCILWHDIPQEIGEGYSRVVTVTYSDVEGGTPGEGNIDADPLFADPSNGDFHLTEPSLCIDSGNPDSPLDPDNTVADMGAFYFHHDYDIHHFNSVWNWESFPRINIEPNNNNPTNIVPILDAIDPDFTELYMRYDSDLPDDYVLEFEGNEWFPTSYNARSSYLYKIEILPEQESILTVVGDRLPVDYSFPDTEPLEPWTYHWLGYWLPQSQNIVDAFGEEYWQYVEKVKSEDWYYNKCSIIRVGDPSVTVSWSTEDKTLEYGKGYMVWFNYETIENFHWTDSGASEEPKERGTSEYFTYEEKSDYEVVDVIGIPENVAEIGVFEDDQCVGAVVVQDSCAQILVYSNIISRDPKPFNFEIVTGRDLSIPIKNYKVFNWTTGEFEREIIISGMQEYSIIMLGEEGEQEDNAISITQLHNNYPNPFNPSTSISFSIPEEAKVSLKIFNIKGQKVKILVNSNLDKGFHSIIWNGDNESNEPVGSGVYFYKLSINGKSKSVKKCLLLK